MPAALTRFICVHTARGLCEGERPTVRKTVRRDAKEPLLRNVTIPTRQRSEIVHFFNWNAPFQTRRASDLRRRARGAHLPGRVYVPLVDPDSTATRLKPHGAAAATTTAILSLLCAVTSLRKQLGVVSLSLKERRHVFLQLA